MEFVPYHPGNNKFTSEFIAENFGPHKMDMSVEEKFGVVPPPLSKTSKMNDPGPPRKMRVKSGYTGHVPHGRDYIGGSYKAHDNRGTASKEDVPILHVDGSGGYPIPVVPKKSNMSKLIYSQDPHSSKAGDLQHDYGVTTTAPVAARVEKVLSGDTSDMSDAENRTSAFDQEGAGQWIMAGYTGHVRASPHSAPRVARCCNDLPLSSFGALELPFESLKLFASCCSPVCAGSQGPRGVRHLVLRPARGPVLSRSILHLRHLRVSGLAQQGGHLPVSSTCYRVLHVLSCARMPRYHTSAVLRRGEVPGRLRPWVARRREKSASKAALCGCGYVHRGPSLTATVL